MTENSKKILVVGATGYTGRLIVAELQRKGLAFVIAGRSAERLAELRREFKLGEEVAAIVANPLKPETLPAMFEHSVGVVINCAGPFTTLGEPVVRETLEHEAHYLDITGEQAYIAKIITNYHVLALAKKRTVVPGCGVEYALSNWTAALAARDLEPLDSLATATVSRNVQTTQGTQRSLFAALGSYGIGWRDGKRVIKMPGSEVRRFHFPPPFGEQSAVSVPFGDTVTLPRHIKTKRVDAYMAVPAGAAFGMKLFSPILPVMSGFLGLALDPLIGAGQRGPQEERRKSAQWAVMAEAIGPQGRRTAILQGRDVYGLTAVITVWAAEQMLAPGFKQAGVLGPAQAFDPAAAVEYLKDFGVSFTTA